METALLINIILVIACTILLGLVSVAERREEKCSLGELKRVA